MSDVLGRDQIIDVMKYLGHHTHNDDGTLTDQAFAVSNELAGKVTENNFLPTQIASAMKRHELTGKECEFCGDPATKAEKFDREVYVCDQCHAN